jgi:methionyl-tRNA synthetase
MPRRATSSARTCGSFTRFTGPLCSCQPAARADQIVVHGFLTNEGKKISKSSGDAADPIEYVDALGVDAVRHFLLRHVRPFEDSDFSRARLEAAYDADLAHGIGNLTSRLTALCESAVRLPYRRRRRAAGAAWLSRGARIVPLSISLSTTLWDEVARLNRELGVLRPWEDVKHGRFAKRARRSSH